MVEEGGLAPLNYGGFEKKADGLDILQNHLNLLEVFYTFRFSCFPLQLLMGPQDCPSRF